MSYGSIANSPLILHAAIHVAHLGLVTHSINSSYITKQQTQSVRNYFEKLVSARNSEQSGKQSFHDGDYFVHVLNKNGRVYLCHTPKATKFRVVYNMLDDLDTELTKIPRLINANKSDITYFLKETVTFYNDPSNDKITNLQKQIDVNVGKMIDNIDKILANQDSMNVILTQTEDIKENASLFERGGRKMKRNMQFRLFVVIGLMVLICSVILGIAILLIGLKIAGKI